MKTQIQRKLQMGLLRDWYERFSITLTGLFLLQYVYWIQQEGEGWLPATVAVVEVTIVVTVVIEWILRLHQSLRWFIQLTALLLATGAMVINEPIRRDVSNLSEVSNYLRDIFIQFVPFVWFALAAWLITLIVIKLMQSKKNIMFMLVATVTAFAIRDSFSPIDLWMQTAAAIACGLFLLTIRHFTELNKSNPNGLQQLSKISPFIALSGALLLSFVVLTGIFAPDVRAVLTDPYTMWKNMQGNQSAISGNVEGGSISLGAVTMSGYSLDDSSLGGQLFFDETPVMTAATTLPSYWRGETRTIYTGNGWAESEADRRMLQTSVLPNTALTNDPITASTNLRTIEVTQTITMLEGAEEEYPVLFGAYAIDKLQGITNGGTDTDFSPLQWLPQVSELRWTDNGRQSYPDSYSITSQVPVFNESELRNSAAELPLEAGLDEYLVLPESLPNRVTELAIQVTETGTNHYDKAKLIERYLSSTYPYTNTPDLSKGQSPDFVDRFLFEIQEGYCDYYSTAMVVMARSIGIPARWVKGFTTGEASSEGVYTVRNSDAHSWVEIYFTGFGWIPFEPTASYELPVYMPDDASIAELIPEPPVEEEVNDEMETLPDMEIEEMRQASENDSLPRSLWWGIGIAFIAALLFLVWRFRLLWPTHRQLDMNQQAVSEFERFLQYAKRKGYIRVKHETAREVLQRWFDSDNQAGSEDLETILVIFEKAKYSGSSISGEELTSLSLRLQQLRQEMKGTLQRFRKGRTD
ncbi:transglutaminase TgpA family protein [Paenibacillus arenilitoris]|uniref:Transglutaminase domain-containing protein n=1 Tax=Paenibacillus arenilitoris TaxID=2772299 RepID=A0A927CVU3_9BACL|nr:transglutaminaseTgpA domain-containing protein [Paenibacillus arenilitoris]MBD2872470.1 transglutaminase domain-containing protein [Paenibacillus arenilitoris]